MSASSVAAENEKTPVVADVTPATNTPSTDVDNPYPNHKNREAFSLLPVPHWLAYDTARPFHFGLFMNISFGLFATFTVSNLYYCQPILGSLATSFGVSKHEVSNIPTLVQAGYATGLLFITPLGDLVRRRQLILLLILCSTCLSIGLAVTSSLVVFEAITFLVGFSSVVPQILIPLAADLAPPERRAGAIGIVWAALMMGVLLGRVLSGTITNFVSYRNVYYMAIGLQSATFIAAYTVIPNYPAKNLSITYLQILWSMAKLAVTEPLLIQMALLIFISNMCFSSFWVTLTFLLLDAPYHYSDLHIGLFGLLGMLGVALGPFLGRTMDVFLPWYGSLFSTAWLLLFQATMVIGGGLNVSAVIISVLGLDVFRQMFAVSLTAQALSINAEARSRINAVMTVSIFLGQVVGTSGGTTVFLKYGWRACYGLALAWTGLQLVVLLARGPYLPKNTWLGWNGGLTPVRKNHSKPKQTATDVEGGGKDPVNGQSEEKVVNGQTAGRT